MSFIVEHIDKYKDFEVTGVTFREQMISVLKQMKVGDLCRWPIEKIQYVRSTTTNYGITNRKRYSTRADRESGYVYVKRVS